MAGSGDVQDRVRLGAAPARAGDARRLRLSARRAAAGVRRLRAGARAPRQVKARRRPATPHGADRVRVGGRGRRAVRRRDPAVLRCAAASGDVLDRARHADRACLHQRALCRDPRRRGPGRAADTALPAPQLRDASGRAGWAAKFIQDQVGHSHAATTAVYMSVGDDFKDRLVRAAIDEQLIRLRRTQ